MKRIQSKAVLLKKRVRAVRNRAKFAGLLYLFGTIALAGITAIVAFVSGAYISKNGELMVVKSFISELLYLVKGDGTTGGYSAVLKDADLLVRALSALIYAVLLIIVVVNVLRSLGKLNWLFKRRASYANGFNRNAYAMDDLGARYAGSFSAMIVCNLLIFALGGTQFTTLGYYAIIGGVALHFIAGLIAGKVTLFTTGDRMEEEPRESGTFVFFVRNLLQFGVLAGIFVLFICNPFVQNKSTGANPSTTALGGLIRELLDLCVVQRNFGAVTNTKFLVPLVVELLTWICFIVLIKHATGVTEFSRDGLDGAGINNFAVFGFLTAVCLATLGALPQFGFGEWLNTQATSINQTLIIASVVAFAGFVLDCIIRPRQKVVSYDDVDTDAYFSETAEAKYNNTII